MMRISFGPRGIALVAATCAAPLAAASVADAQSAYVLDRSNSLVTFKGRALLQGIRGQSDDLAGRMSMLGSDVRSMRGDVRFDVATLDTEPELQPTELLEIFGGKRHPTVYFHIDSVERGGGSTPWQVHGRLTMNGVTRPVSFTGQGSLGHRRVSATGTATVDVREWRIRPPRRLGGLVGMSPHVTLSFRAEFLVRPSAHAAFASPDAPIEHRNRKK